MNIQSQLDDQLWQAIRSNYESRAFTGAILDALHFMGDLIRERAGLGGDGVALVGEAFGGSKPRLRVNRLQTDSDRNIQRGFEQILRGLYLAVRNPRSHAKVNDDERDAIAIILMIDYLLREINRTQSPFSVGELVGKVVDPGFVQSKRYSSLIVERIPPSRRLAVCLELFSRRDETAGGLAVAVFFEVILDLMSDEERSSFYDAVSDELERTTDDSTIRFVIQALPAARWPEVNETARLRIENMLIKSVQDGRSDPATGRCPGGALGTWIHTIYANVTLKDELWHAVSGRLTSSDITHVDYVRRYFLYWITEAFERPPRFVERFVNSALRDGNTQIKNVVSSWRNDQQADGGPWFAPFQSAFEAFVAESLTDEEIPF